jgi:hypothetical protein
MSVVYTIPTDGDESELIVIIGVKEYWSHIRSHPAPPFIVRF